MATLSLVPCLGRTTGGLSAGICGLLRSITGCFFAMILGLLLAFPMSKGLWGDPLIFFSGLFGGVTAGGFVSAFLGSGCPGLVSAGAAWSLAGGACADGGRCVSSDLFSRGRRGIRKKSHAKAFRTFVVVGIACLQPSGSAARHNRPLSLYAPSPAATGIGASCCRCSYPFHTAPASLAPGRRCSTVR